MQEEENHLKEMQNDLENNPKLTNLIPLCLEIETGLYLDMLLGIKKEIT